MIWTSVRGIECVRIMLRSVLCTRVSRCRSLGPVEESLSAAEPARVWCFGMQIRTSYAHGRPHVDFNRSFFGQLIAALDFDGAIDGANDGVRVVRVRGRAVCAVQMGEGDCRGAHGWG
jgi:hypothetical protein